MAFDIDMIKKVYANMAERVDKLADEKNTTFTSILIEALDSFLRKSA